MLSFKLPENDSKYEWTNHVKGKMVYYGISSSLIKRIVRFPKRKEEGVAPGTTAVMQPRGSAKTSQEIWVMYQLRRPPKESVFSTVYGKAVASEPKTRVISAWRYPGISPVGKKIPIPDEILQELESII
jgi:hypothetical protein